EADTDDNQGTLGFEEFCSFYKMMSTRRDLYLLMLTYSNLKDHLDTDDLARFLETEQKMTKVTKDHCLEIINKFEPCSENQKQGVLGIDGFTNYMRSPAGDIFNPEHYNVIQDMNQSLCNYFIASSHNTYLMGDQLMSQSRVDMYAWVLQAGCRCVEVDCWDGQDGEPIVHHGYTLTSKILFKDVIETINKYAFIKNEYPVILSIENHCSVPQQKKMAQYLIEILGDKLDLSNIKAEESGRLPSPEMLKGKILVKGKKLPPNIDENAEEGDVSDEDSADEMEDDCKLMNGDTSANRKQVENMAKKKLDNLMKESKIRDREDPDSFTITALPPAGKPTDKTSSKGKSEDGTDTADEANSSSNKRTGRSFMGSFSKRKKKTSKLKKSSSFEDTDTDQETNCSWQVSSLSETKAHQVMQQKATSFIHFNQRQLSRIYPSSYRVDSSNFNPQPFWNAGCQLVALNYQSEGRVLQLNRAKFYSNGNCGYILKPACMCEGAFNPNLEDPLPGQMKKQLVLKIISGQQLPKPKDSMLGDRGEIIDPFVEVEIIGLPVDCCKEQTRVVDDNGFNPMWEETLVFTVHMPELALVRFLVWDHDPIGQDFIGQRTIAFNMHDDSKVLICAGYRHVYLEGMEEASIFVHVAVNDITGKAKAASGIKGLFHRNPKQASLDSHAAAQHSRKHPFGAHLLRRTASAPTKGQPKIKKGFPEIAIDTKDYSSEGASEERESEDKASAAASHQPTTPLHRNGDSLASHQAKGPWDHPDTNGAFHPEEGKGKSPLFAHRCPMSEPLKRASRLRFHDPLDAKPGVFARVALNSSGRVGMSSNCITCVMGSKESPEAERKGLVKESQECKSKIEHGERQERSNHTKRQVQPEPIAKPQPLSAQTQQSPLTPKSCVETPFQYSPEAVLHPITFSRSKTRRTLGVHHIRPQPDASQRNTRSFSVPRRRSTSTVTPAQSFTADSRTNLHCQEATPPKYGTVCAIFTNTNANEGLSLSDSSSCDSLCSLSSLESLPMLPSCSVHDSSKRAVGTLQREMNALFAQKMEELRHKSPMFFADYSTVQKPAPPPPFLALNFEDAKKTRLIRSVSTPEESQSSHHSSSTTVHSPSTAINADSPLTIPSNGFVDSPMKVSGDPKNPPMLLKTTSLYLTNPAEKFMPSQCGQDTQTNRNNRSFMEHTSNQRENHETLPEKKNDTAELKSEHRTEPLTAASSAVSTGTPVAPPAQTAHARRALFSSLPSHAPVRRTKSEGHVRVAVASAVQAQSAVPEVCTDATMNDRLWSKLEPGSHRDSMSSSSSISSSDTVIDLSLPNLARKSLTSLPTASSTCDPPWVSCRRSALVSYDAMRVSKSKSNPNLQQSECSKDELKPRPLQPPQEVSVDSPSRLTQRRHTWSRLYMEGLKQSSASRPSPASATSTTTASMSKSLGDLTSDDISCNFDSKYRSISRSFIVRPTRDQLRKGSPQKSRPSSDLTEQLRKLTNVEPLTASDFAQETRHETSQEESVDETLVRRTSSRSQSRVRYIANRAKKAQERQRLQSLVQGRSASFSLCGSIGSGNSASPIEERGNPEGACCVARSPCTSLDLLSQLTPLGTPSPRQSQSSPDPENSEVFFMLKL
ncbi:1-phosphatidylinositol 4, partial [Nibea albiflora]